MTICSVIRSLHRSADRRSPSSLPLFEEDIDNVDIEVEGGRKGDFMESRRAGSRGANVDFRLGSGWDDAGDRRFGVQHRQGLAFLHLPKMLGQVILKLLETYQLHDPSIAEAVGSVNVASAPVAEAPPTVAGNGYCEEDDRLAVLLRRDLTALLAKLHRGSVDFFRPGRGGSGKQMVPESVFSAHLALGFELMGWRVERESQSAAGRTDLKLRRNGSPETVLVEVKIWGRNDYRDAQRQVESYWTTEISSGAVVQIADVQVDDWGEQYRRECLAADGLTVEVGTPEDGSPISVQLTVTSAVGAMPASVEHFLLRLPRK